MPSSVNPFQASDLSPWLERCGYAADNIVSSLPISNGRAAACAGFSQRPFDSRSACIVALDVDNDPEEAAVSCRTTGAPIALLCQGSELLWWKQEKTTPKEYLRVPSRHIEGFFREHANDLAPNTIYRAKTLGRFNSEYQRDFVDLGLMPAVESEMGVIIERLLLEQVAILRASLDWSQDVSESQGQWLIKSVFWLLGAKMLHDKKVEGFIRLDFSDVEKVFDRVARHYGQSAEAIISSQKKLKALQIVSNQIAQRADLGLASTEALAYVYENTLISREIRKSLGTHSTPSYLIDYVVGRLTPWIEEMRPEQRSVFEPACGHGGFLVSAVRLLTSLLPVEQASPQNRRSYLRQQIRGFDKDPFALEIARLSLTLTDIPNPNGWKLQEEDAFASDLLEKASSSSRILLANPPFEKFEPEQRLRYGTQYQDPQFINKAAEMLYRSVDSLPNESVFGLVVPQNLLHSKDASLFRKLLVEQTEFDEVCLFPDKVFNFADVESAILVGKKHQLRSDRKRAVRYRRVREGQIDLFKENYGVTSEVLVSPSKFQDQENNDLRVPDLINLWESCRHLQKLNDVAEVGQGFSFIGEDQPNFPEGQKRTSNVAKKGFEQGFENLRGEVVTHGLPKVTYLNMSSEIIRRELLGRGTGEPQVLCNYSPRQRKAWCVAAMIDSKGLHASGCFNLMRSSSKVWSEKIIWAFVNSPIGNAFAYTHSSKRHVLAGTWRKFPIPILDEEPLKLKGLVDDYFKATTSKLAEFSLSNECELLDSQNKLKILHWRIDAEVMRLYALSAEQESELLRYFSGIKRVGVPFEQDRYLPEGFEHPVSLADFLAITADWEETNTRRIQLISKKRASKLTADEKNELDKLKSLANAKAALVSPLPNKELEEQEADLRRRGLWKGK